jgi:hypothetical protein
MVKKINISLIASSLFLSVSFNGCAGSNEKLQNNNNNKDSILKTKEKTDISSIKKDLKERIAKNDDFVNIANKKNGIENKKEVESSFISNYVKEKENVEDENNRKPFFNIKVGDDIKTILNRLSYITENIYIMDDDNIEFISKISVNNIKSEKELILFFLANDHILEFKNIKEKYNKVYVKIKEEEAEKKLKNIQVLLNGAIPVVSIIKEITNEAKVSLKYEDKTAGDVASIIKNVSISGNGYDSLNQVVSNSGLSIEYKKNDVLVSYFKNESFDLDVFVKDRSLANIISNIPSSMGTGTSTTSSDGSTTSATKDLKTEYVTQLVKELKLVLDSSISKNGSYSFLPSTGQIAVRDKGENLKIVQKTISEFNSKFKDNIEMKLVFYKVSIEKGSKRGIDFTAIKSNMINGGATTLNATSSGMIGSTFSTGSPTFGLSLARNGSSMLLNFLKEYGDAEVVNTLSFEAQSNLPKTVKIANNYGYIASISSSNSGTDGATSTGEVNPSSVPDGIFFNIIAKPIANNLIAADIYATSTSLSKFNMVTAFGNTVQTPDTTEQSIDGYHQIKNGIPSILVAHKYSEIKKGGNGLSIEMLDSLGVKEEANKDVYIVISLEANVR